MKQISKKKRVETLRLISTLENNSRGETDRDKINYYRTQIAELRKQL